MSVLSAFVECRTTPAIWRAVATLTFRSVAFRRLLPGRIPSGWPSDVGDEVSYNPVSTSVRFWCPLATFVKLLGVDPDATRGVPFASAVFMRALEREGYETRILFYEED